MADSPVSDLKRRLGSDFALVEKLGEHDLLALHALIQGARHKQAEALTQAQQHALRFVPALLRKPLLMLFT